MLKARSGAEFPRAYALIAALPKDRILDWLVNYGNGRRALHGLEQELRAGDRRRTGWPRPARETPGARRGADGFD